MFSHKQVWAAIDALAQDNNISVSRLAKDAGLDPTTFNKSKRTGQDGRLRWPSTESLSKIMQATSTNIEHFTQLMSEGQAGFSRDIRSLTGLGFSDTEQHPFAQPQSVPLLGLAKAGTGGFFDDAGLPTGEGWEAIAFPGNSDDPVYALEISGDSMLPLYRDGDRIIVAPLDSVRRGDRVVVRTRSGEVLAKELLRQTADAIELKSVNPEFESRTLPAKDIDWIARIVWASQ